jgi:hypothetical protein
MVVVVEVVVVAAGVVHVCSYVREHTCLWIYIATENLLIFYMVVQSTWWKLCLLYAQLSKDDLAHSVIYIPRKRC